MTLANGKVKSRSVHLDVVTPEAIILSTDEYRIEKGSLISLVCILENALLPPEYVFWYQNDRMINYDTARGVTVTTMQGKKRFAKHFLTVKWSVTREPGGTVAWHVAGNEAICKNVSAESAVAEAADRRVNHGCC